MIKKVCRPFWSYDVQKTEKWLSFMAERGYFLVHINRFTRYFYFHKGEPKKRIYRIGYDKMQGGSLSKGLVAEGWTKLLRCGNWFITVNEKSFEQVKFSPVREGIIKHNRVIMYIFTGILIYFAFMLMFFLTMFGIVITSSDSQVEVVESPYWIFTYFYFGAEAACLLLALYSVIKIYKTNKNLTKEKTSCTNTYVVKGLETRFSKLDERQLKRTGQLLVKRKFSWMYAPDKLEAWLEGLEEKGFNLYRVNRSGNTFYFLKGNPRKVSYCADYQNIGAESYFDIHMESGWKSVFVSRGSLQKWSIWSQEYTEDGTRPQVYSDKSTQLKHAKRVAFSYSCLFLPLIIAYSFNLGTIVSLLSVGKIDNTQIYTLIIMFLAIISFGTHTIKIWLYYLRLKKRFDLSM